MTENQLKLNDKTEALLFPFSSSLKPSTVSLPDSITLGSHNIPFSDSARNLGFILDSKLSTKKHVIKICQTAYFELKRISSIRKFLTEDATKTLVTSHILSRLDYCNCLLMGTPNSPHSSPLPPPPPRPFLTLRPASQSPTGITRKPLKVCVVVF